MAATQTEATTTGPGGDRLESVSPFTGEVIGTVPIVDAEGIDNAVSRARTAAATWAAMSHDERRGQLVRLRRSIADHIDELTDLIHRENGKPRLDGTQEVMLALVHLSHAANRASKALRTRRVSSGLFANIRSTISYFPVGVVGVIGPWNYPLFTPMGSIGYALAAGNAVVFKPSELTPLVGVRLGELAAEAIDVPDLLQVVTGDGGTGDALARSGVDKLAFTGSAATGRKVMAAAAERLTPVVIELGGKDPMIVAADADVDKAAKAAVFGALANAGQACVSIERVYVVDSVYDRFVDKVVEHASSITPGADGQIGAITRPQQVDVIRTQLEDALANGAKALVGGPDQIDGNLVAPTVLVDVTDEMKVMRDETFGPVLPIIRVDDAEQAIEHANRVGFRLGSSVWGSAGIRAMADRIKAGMTSINSVLTFTSIPSLPFGGVGESGFGRIHGDEGLREFTRVKATSEEIFALPMTAVDFTDNPDAAMKQAKGLAKQVFGGGVIDQIESRIRKFL